MPGPFQKPLVLEDPLILESSYIVGSYYIKHFEVPHKVSYDPTTGLVAVTPDMPAKTFIAAALYVLRATEFEKAYSDWEHTTKDFKGVYVDD